MSTTIPCPPEAAGEGHSTLALPARKTGKLKLAVISLSIANLCFLLTWKQVLTLAQSPNTRYFEERAPHFSLLFALFFDICAVAVLVFCCCLLQSVGTKAIRYLGAAGAITFGALGLYKVECLVTQWFLELTNYAYDGEIPKIAAACVLLLVIVRFRPRVPQLTIALFLITSAIFPMLALSGLWAYASMDLHPAANQTPAPMLPGGRFHPHVVWIIFDELDAPMLFAGRPQRIKIPEFERLRSESVYALAHTPSTDTVWSMPSFLLGKKVAAVKADTNRLDVKFANSKTFVNTATLPNIFRSARAAGFNSGLTGWHLAYCRVFGSDLNDCSWVSFGPPVVRVEKLLRRRSFLQNALYLLEWQARFAMPGLMWPSHWLTPEPQELQMWREQQIEATKFVMRHGLEMLANPDLNLVLIHVPTPHPVGIWDTRTADFTFGNSDYFDNLALADAALGRIRHTMEQTGAWDTSAVIVSSDHPFRTGMWKANAGWTPELSHAIGDERRIYVPFFLKLPGPQKAVQYKTEFNNVVTSDLALQILNDQVKTSGDAVRWLDANAGASLR